MHVPTLIYCYVLHCTHKKSMMSSPRRSKRILQKRDHKALETDLTSSCMNKGTTTSQKTSRSICISSRKVQPSPLKHEPWDGPSDLSLPYEVNHNKKEPCHQTSRKVQPSSSSPMPLNQRGELLMIKYEPCHQTDVTVNQDLHNKVHSSGQVQTPNTSLAASTHPRDEEQQPTSTGLLLDHLFCQLCQVSCSSGLTMQQHLIGRPHKAKMKYMQMKETGTITGRQWKPRCDVCKICCSDMAALEMHFEGKKHKKNVQELELRIERGGLQESSKEPILCELCCVPCMNLELYEMHLKGKKHAAKLLKFY